jgi:hypothetical protein
MDKIVLKDWSAVCDYIDSNRYQIPMSTVEYLIQHASLFPKTAYSKGQLASKSWLLQQLPRVPLHKELSTCTVGIVGSWIGTLVEPLLLNYPVHIDRIYGFDMDPRAIELSEKLNNKYLADNWSYKGVVADVSTLDFSNLQFETGGELITTELDIIINTSCEHMNLDWFDSVSDSTLIVMQTNNSEQFEGHINTVSSCEQMQSLYPIDTSYMGYVGELQTPVYTRYMQIGYKK